MFSLAFFPRGKTHFDNLEHDFPGGGKTNKWVEKGGRKQ